AVHWTQASPGTSPPARFGGVEAYDKAHQTLVLFGGAGDTGTLGDTWVWNGTNWRQMHPATSPPARIYHYMAYDSTHHYVILFGGVTTSWVNDTWTWDGTNWTQRFPAASPSPRASYAGISDDPAIGGALLYGGYDQTNVFFDTWRWNGTNWIQLSPANHPNYYLASMVYSAPSGKVLAYVQGTAETWTFDGTNWVQRFPSSFPPSRYENGFGALGKGGLLFGGGSGGSFFGDTWYFNGTNWTQVVGSGPSARGYVSLALDRNGRVVLFGGLDSSYVTLGDTWTFAP
ncbi:MAG TPA: kelch repeat-containing protein, partial [Actinomycetota bacterium]